MGRLMEPLLGRVREESSTFTALDKVALSSPLSLALAAYFIITGTRIALADFSLVPPLPFILTVGLVFSVTLGGLLIVAGILWPRTAYTGRAVEQAGHFLAASAWLAYALTNLALGYGLTAAHSVAIGIVFALGCLGRARALHKANRAVVRAETRRTNGGE